MESGIKKRKDVTGKEKGQDLLRGRKSAAPVSKRTRCLDTQRSRGTKGATAVSADAVVHKSKRTAGASDLRESSMVITRSGKRVAEDSSEENEDEKSSEHGWGRKRARHSENSESEQYQGHKRLRCQVLLRLCEQMEEQLRKHLRYLDKYVKKDREEAEGPRSSGTLWRDRFARKLNELNRVWERFSLLNGRLRETPDTQGHRRTEENKGPGRTFVPSFTAEQERVDDLAKDAEIIHETFKDSSVLGPANKRRSKDSKALVVAVSDVAALRDSRCEDRPEKVRTVQLPWGVTKGGSTQLPTVPLMIAGRLWNALLDTGASASFVSLKHARFLRKPVRRAHVEEVFYSATGEAIPTSQCIPDVEIQIGSKTILQTLLIAAIDNEIVLGYDCLIKANLVPCGERLVRSFRGEQDGPQLALGRVSGNRFRRDDGDEDRE